VTGRRRSTLESFLATRGSCDCGTEIGICIRAERNLPPFDSDFSRVVKNFKKKGLSDSKIDRWIQQSKTDTARKHNKATASLICPHPELTRWIEIVSSVLQGRHADCIGILVHWYGGNVATESIAAGNRRWLRLEELTEEYLLNAHEDTLYTVTLNANMTNIYRIRFCVVILGTCVGWTAVACPISDLWPKKLARI